MEWGNAKESGDVKVCCSWTAAPNVEDPRRATRRCCVWTKKERKKRPRSPTLTMRVGAEFDDDYEHECSFECSEATGCFHAVRESWVAREALRLAGRSEAIRRQWRTEIPPGILYSTRRYEETMRLAFNECGRLLRQPADLKWVERAQCSIDVDAIEEDIVVAERELEWLRRNREEWDETSREWDEIARAREETTRRLEEDPARLAVERETRSSRKRRIAQEVERLREDETLHDELVLRRPTKKAKKFNF